MVATGLEIYIKSRTPRLLSCLFQSQYFGVLLSVVSVETLADKLAARIHQHGANVGIRRDEAKAFLCKLNGPAQELLIRLRRCIQRLHSRIRRLQDMSESTNSFGSNRNRSPAFSPMPT